jgi:hypothetical protein
MGAVEHAPLEVVPYIAPSQNFANLEMELGGLIETEYVNEVCIGRLLELWAFDIEIAEIRGRSERRKIHDERCLLETDRLEGSSIADIDVLAIAWGDEESR